MKTLVRVFAWVLLLGSAIGSFAAAIWVTASGHCQSLVLFAPGPGVLANWLLFFLTLSISACVYLIRGIDGDGWSINFRGVALVLGLSLVVLLTGFAGLVVFIVVTGIMTERQLRRRRNVGGI